MNVGKATEMLREALRRAHDGNVCVVASSAARAALLARRACELAGEMGVECALVALESAPTRIRTRDGAVVWFTPPVAERIQGTMGPILVDHSVWEEEGVIDDATLAVLRSHGAAIPAGKENVDG